MHCQLHQQIPENVAHWALKKSKTVVRRRRRKRVYLSRDHPRCTCVLLTNFYLQLPAKSSPVWTTKFNSTLCCVP